MPERGQEEVNMSVNSLLARIYGSELDAVWLAPLGTALPTDLSTDPGAAFEDVGWLDTDTGITETATGSVTKLRGHQGNGVVRTRMEETGTQIQFTALETKALTLGLRYDERNVTTTDGVRHARRSPGQKVKAMAAVIDLKDADDETVAERFCIPRFEIAPNGDRVNVSTALATLPYIGEIIGFYDHYMTDLESDE